MTIRQGDIISTDPQYGFNGNLSVIPITNVLSGPGADITSPVPGVFLSRIIPISVLSGTSTPTRIYYYTSGIGNPSPFGTQQSQPTTTTLIYSAMVAALNAAGWTQHNKGTNNDVWASTGESGTEAIFAQTSLTSSTHLNFFVGLALDGSNNLLGSIGGNTTTFDSWLFPSATVTVDYQILASKNFAWFIVRNTSGNVVWSAFFGIPERDNVTIPNVLITSGSTTAGTTPITSGTIPVSVDPRQNGYTEGDFIQIISQSSPIQAQTVKIVSIQRTGDVSWNIIVDNLALTYPTGSRVGAQPVPTVRFVSGSSGNQYEPNNGTGWYMPMSATGGTLSSTTDIPTTTPANTGVNISAVDFASGSTITAQDGFGVSGTADKRTRRYTCRQLELRAASIIANTGYTVLGRIPGVYGCPDTLAYYPNDSAQYNRIPSPQNFAAARFIASSTSNWVIGPSP